MTHKAWLRPFALMIGVSALFWFLAGCRFAPEPGPAESNQASDQLIDGKSLYDAHCASCHGIEGEGQPNWQIPNADGVYLAPPHNSEGHTWHHPDQVLLDITAKGGALPNSGMPGFADKLTQSEMETILAYIKTFWDPDQRDIQADVSKRWQEQTQ